MSNLDTFHQCIEAANRYLLENSATSSEFADHLFTGGVSYGEKREWHFEIDKLKNRGTKKFFHFVIYRTERGLYENVNYIL